MLALGIAGSLVGLALFHSSGGNQPDPATLIRAQTMVFSYIVLYEMMLVFMIRRNYQVPPLSNPWLWCAVFFSLFLQVIILYTPMNQVFHVVPLYRSELGLLFGATGLFVVLCFILEALLRVSENKKSTTSYE